MKKLTGLLLATTLSAPAYAVTVDTALWTVEKSPSGSTGSTWTSTGGNQAIQNRNSDGTLVSDFSETGDFTFSGTLNATGNDNDIVGIVFGWADDQNHYRLGWERGGLNDQETQASGMFLIKEVAGVSTVLFEQEDFYTNNVNYDFFAGRSGDDISFSLNGISQTFTDTSFMSGNIGFYTVSQTATFSGLASVPTPPAPVSEPLSLGVLGLGLVGLGFMRKKIK